MGKIGRNDPCPCGSGKKYKKCCLAKEEAQAAQLRASRKTHWSLKEVDSLSEDEIVSRLRFFGVRFEKAEFLEDVKKYYSAEHLVAHWRKEHPITAVGFDEDFVWMAAVILWRRLAPDVISSEKLDDMMQEGYRFLRSSHKEEMRKNVIRACNIWLEVWEHLKTRFRPDMKAIDDAEWVFDGSESLSNWCEDFEMELHNAGLEDPFFFEERIRYCREFCDLFPDSDDLIMHNMKRGEAEAHFLLGREAEGDRLFEALIKRFPDNPWGYIGWGDMYAWPIKDKGLPDKKRAEQIYKMGLIPEVKDKKDILDRIEDLDKED